LHAAVVGGQKKVVEFLITKGADVNAKDRGGYTPLFYAVWHNREETAKLLLDKGADPNVRSVWNRTPLHWAVRQGGSKEMIELLVAKGADVNLKRGDATALKMAKDNGHTEIVELLRKLGAKE
jgi:ankyrin repeat protein